MCEPRCLGESVLLISGSLSGLGELVEAFAVVLSRAEQESLLV
jgi:hypothetical protein